MSRQDHSRVSQDEPSGPLRELRYILQKSVPDEEAESELYKNLRKAFDEAGVDDDQLMRDSRLRWAQLGDKIIPTNL